MMNKSKFVLWLCTCLFLLSCSELPYSSPDGELRLECIAGDGQSPSFKVYKVIKGDTLEVMHLPMTGVWMENGIGRNLHLN